LLAMWQNEKAAGTESNGLPTVWLPTVDNIRYFFLTPATQLPSFFQQLREAD